MYQQLIDTAVENKFYIKKGYISREETCYFLDTDQPNNREIWQPQIYKIAEYIAKQLNKKYIIDIGCGNAKKLVDLYPNFDIIGIDFGENLKTCKEKYSFGTWIEHDLETNQPLNIPENTLNSSVIICADVIEHLINPGYLLWKLKLLLDQSSLCIISTPERDLERGYNDLGPPLNLHHVREWNMQEFISLIKSFEFNLLFNGLTISENIGKHKKTILNILGNNHINNPTSALLKSPQILEDINRLL